jgi:hypothetical protein
LRTQAQPLASEVIGERGRARVIEHSLYLHRASPECGCRPRRPGSSSSGINSQEVAEARREFQIANGMRGDGVDGWGRARYGKRSGGRPASPGWPVNSLLRGLPVGSRHGDNEQRCGFTLVTGRRQAWCAGWKRSFSTLGRHRNSDRR